MTTPESPGKAYTIAALLGAALWIVGSKVSDRREAWDSETYWIFFYPAAIGACAALAYLFPDRPWRWCIVNSGIGRGWGSRAITRLIAMPNPSNPPSKSSSTRPQLWPLTSQFIA